MSNFLPIIRAFGRDRFSGRNPIALCLAALLCIVGLGASRKAAELQHQVNFPVGDAEWSVLFKSDKREKPRKSKSPASLEGAPASSIKQRKSVEIVRQGHLRRDLVTRTDGTTTQIWWVGKPEANAGQEVTTVLVERDTDGLINAMKASYMLQHRFDASAFDWVDANCFVKLADYNGTPCQYYKLTITVEGEDGPEKRSLHAWLDAKTLMPVALDNGSCVASFAFKEAAPPEPAPPEPAPPEPLQMPERFQKELERFDAFRAPPQRSAPQ